MPKSRRSYLVVPVLIVLCSLGAGVFMGGGVSAATPEEVADQSLRSFASVFDVVENNFADQVNAPKSVYKGAIPGMLRTLDPHSNFFDPKEFKMMREDQRGSYAGVGMQVGPRNGKTIVINPFPDSPAAKAGIRPGDIIQQVNDTKTDGLSTTEIAELLRGTAGTSVQVQIGREGVTNPIFFNIVRGAIPRFSVTGGFFVKPGIAFIRIESFNENTGQELEKKFKDLNEKNVQGLILDLRANPGGVLTEGVDVSAHFLKKGELVVSHRGRNSPNRNYTAPRDGSGKDYPVVILVDRYTASAAEIVSGALQDHDRAWILGENTFGKGLVQSVMQLGDETGLTLTTAHYYTPSGRLIQRDYSNISFLDYYNHSNLEEKNLQDVKMTDSGRTVYGGGGISPDEKYEPLKANEFQTAIMRKDAFFYFTARYFGTRDATLPKGWEPDNAIIGLFGDYLKEIAVAFTPEQMAENRDWVRKELKVRMYMTAFSSDESQRVAIEQDPMVLKGIESLPKAKQLLESAKNLRVQRMNRQADVAATVAR